MNRSLIVVSVALAVGLGAWALFSPSRPPDAELLLNRFWIERIPEHDRDIVHSFIAASDGEERIGLFGASSAWRIRADLFRFRLDGRRLEMEFPQDRTRGTVEVKAWRCQGEAPRPFELCLELRHRRGAKRFYSREDWTLGEGAVRAPEAALRAFLNEVSSSAARAGEAADEPLSVADLLPWEG